jgi:hypothetical protein
VTAIVETMPSAVEVLGLEALAAALTRASTAGRGIVATLAHELHARRDARVGVVDLDAARKRRDGS